MAPNDISAPRDGASCSICGKPMVRAYRPFCSARCRDIDLSRWLHGVYRIETDEDPDGEQNDAG
jgi:endogenous inhibitor of DNA gyrase (YacG/DUF329 family)